ncbi:3988_t:CDS:2, partial [Cetraspora pellucida]
MFPEFESANELYQYAQTFANARGFALVKKRTQGAHANLKAYLQTSAGDLHRVHTKISLMVTNQKEEINSMTVSERIRFPIFAHNNQFYANVRGKVSTFALKKINREYQKASCVTVQNPLPLCTGSFSRTMGLPCAHRIQHLESSQGLTLEDIHIHWWIQGRLPIPQFEEHVNTLQSLLQNLEQRYNEWLEHQQAATRKMLNDMINSSSIVLQNPNIICTKECPLGATNNQPSTSTRRDPSGFESVEQNVRQCSLCRQPGHNARTCPNR